jgi:Xaa-Pro dipeptidase
MRRRSFLSAAAPAVALAAAPDSRPEWLRSLSPMTGGVGPITAAERDERIERARRLMAASKLDAVVLEPGSSLSYFTGIRWWRSERTFAWILPARGEMVWIVPGFEEGRAREIIHTGSDIRHWEEDESPFALVAGALADRGVRTGRLGIEESTRFFVFDGIRQAAPALQLTTADPVTAGCRMIKSAAELAILRRANEITLAGIAAASRSLREGMPMPEFRANLDAAYRALGPRGGGLILFGKHTASPHGTTEPQKLREGDFVLVDAGVELEGYSADITRTWVFGKPSARQRQIWDLERKAQDAALAAAKPGATCESVDAAARKVIVDAGFGPGYKLPGLPHRTGHGVGLDGHEWTNLVRGNKTRMAPGMCFSDEPTIAIPGEFGIRLEDCFHVTEEGGRMFTPQSPSIDQPFG